MIRFLAGILLAGAAQAATLVAGPMAGVYLAHILATTGVVHPSLISWLLATNMMMWSPLSVSAATALADPDDLPAIAYLGFAIAVLGWWFAL